MVVKLDGGVMYLDVEPGFSSGKAIAEDQHAMVHYTGWLAEAGKRFDDSWGKGRPEDFNFSKGRLIDGFIQGFIGMREGGVRLIYIPWDKGYGEAGNGPDIPPKTDLLFKVHLGEILGEVPKPPAIDVDRADRDD